jgi:hypothetical protein
MQPMFRQVPPSCPFDQHGGNAQLAGADGGHIAAGPPPMTSSLVSIPSSSLHEQQGRGFEQPRTAWMNCAASMPSTTRWSNEDDRFIILRATTWPLRSIGRSTMRLTPTMATSGWLITGC